MKKIFTLVALVLIAFSADAKKTFDFEDNGRRLEIGFNLGQVGRSGFMPLKQSDHNAFARFGWGVNAVIGGVYVDFTWASAQHKFDNHISPELYHDNEAFSINAGYQIPVTDWFRFMPVFGYSQTNEGITDCSTINFSSSSSSVTLYHDYNVTPGTRVHSFNYGLGISIQPLSFIVINAVATKHALYGGIAFALGSNRR